MAVGNEQIIAALIQAPDVKRAAQSLEITPQCIYNRLRDSVFRAEYAAARGRILEESCYKLQSYVKDCVETMHEIAVDAENAPQIRLNACDALLRHMVRISELVDVMARLEKLEEWKNG